MSKLTLSVDAGRAKRSARRRGAGEPEDPPVLRRLRGLLRHGDREDYRRQLARKHIDPGTALAWITVSSGRK